MTLSARLLIILSILIVSNGLLATAQYVQLMTPEHFTNSLKSYPVSDSVNRLKSLRADELLNETQALIKSDGMPAVVKEQLLYEVSLLLGSLPQSTQALTLARQLQGFESIVFVEHFDGGHKQKLMAFPIAANALAVQHHWSLHNQWQAFQEEGKFIHERFIAHLEAKVSDNQEALINFTLNKLTSANIQVLTQEIINRQAKLSGQQLLQIARKGGDAGLFRLAIEQMSGTKINIRPVYLTGLNKIWSDDVVKRLLDTMLARHIYPNLVLPQLKSQPHLSQQQRKNLLSLLSHKHYGGDAAMVLGHFMDTAILDEMRLLLETGEKRQQRRAMLALKLSVNPDARGLLTDYFKRHPDADLRREVLP